MVQPDVGRVGGLTEARRVAMHAATMACSWCRIAGNRRSASPPRPIWLPLRRPAPTSNSCPPRCRIRACGEILVLDELPVVDGRIPLPTKPGLGITINEAALKAFKVA